MAKRTISALTASVPSGPKTSTKPVRNELHDQAYQPGKRFATANDFARTRAFFSCQMCPGKPCSGKPSLFKEEKAAKGAVCRSTILSPQHVTKLIEAADGLCEVVDDLLQTYEGATTAIGEIEAKRRLVAYFEAVQGFRGLAC